MFRLAPSRLFILFTFYVSSAFSAPDDGFDEKTYTHYLATSEVASRNALLYAVYKFEADENESFSALASACNLYEVDNVGNATFTWERCVTNAISDSVHPVPQTYSVYNSIAQVTACLNAFLNACPEEDNGGLTAQQLAEPISLGVLGMLGICIMCVYCRSNSPPRSHHAMWAPPVAHGQANPPAAQAPENAVPASTEIPLPAGLRAAAAA